MKVTILTDTKDGVIQDEIDLSECPKFEEFLSRSFGARTVLQEQIFSVINDYFIRVRGISVETIENNYTVIKSIDFGSF